MVDKIQYKCELSKLSAGTLQRSLSVLMRVQTGCRGSRLRGFDINALCAHPDDQSWSVKLYDAAFKIITEWGIALRAVRSDVRFLGGKTDGCNWSKVVECNRIRPDMLVDTKVPHRDTQHKVNCLDVVRIMYEMQRHKDFIAVVAHKMKRGCSFTDMRQTTIKFNKLKALHEPGFAPESLSAAALNQAVTKLMNAAGINVRADRNERVSHSDAQRMLNPTEVNDTYTTRHAYAAHAIRGNSGSLIRAVNEMGHVNWPEDEHLRRLRHTAETFEKSYWRCATHRPLQAARQHASRKYLTPDEVVFL